MPLLIIAELPLNIDTGGEVDFRRDVLLFLSTKGGRYSPPRRKNTLFWWHLPPLFDFATSILPGGFGEKKKVGTPHSPLRGGRP